MEQDAGGFVAAAGQAALHGDQGLVAAFADGNGDAADEVEVGAAGGEVGEHVGGAALAQGVDPQALGLFSRHGASSITFVIAAMIRPGVGWDTGGFTRPRRGFS